MFVIMTAQLTKVSLTTVYAKGLEVILLGKRKLWLVILHILNGHFKLCKSLYNT
jgi:hypothetical protein